MTCLFWDVFQNGGSNNCRNDGIRNKKERKKERKETDRWTTVSRDQQRFQNGVQRCENGLICLFISFLFLDVSPLISYSVRWCSVWRELLWLSNSWNDRLEHLPWALRTVSGTWDHWNHLPYLSNRDQQLENESLEQKYWAERRSGHAALRLEHGKLEHVPTSFFAKKDGTSAWNIVV